MVARTPNDPTGCVYTYAAALCTTKGNGGPTGRRAPPHLPSVRHSGPPGLRECRVRSRTSRMAILVGMVYVVQHPHYSCDHLSDREEPWCGGCVCARAQREREREREKGTIQFISSPLCVFFFFFFFWWWFCSCASCLLLGLLVYPFFLVALTGLK